MPTQFIKGQSEPCNGGRIRKTTAGKWCGEVSDGGKIRRVLFDTKAEAQTHLSEMKSRRNEQGKIALALTGDQVRDALDAMHRMEAAGIVKTKLCHAVDFYIKHNRPHAKDYTFKEALAAYLEDLRQPTDGGSPARPETLRSKRKRLSTFTDTHGKKSVRQITDADISAWVESFGEIAPRTVLNRRAELQSVFNWCETNLPDFVNTVCKVKQRRKTETAPAEILTPAQTRAMLHAMEADYPPRYVLTFALMFFAGIRPLELLRPDNPLRWENIRLEEKTIFIPAKTSKTRTFRTVPITANLAAWIERYPGEGRIAPSESRFRAARTDALKKARVKSWPPDGARHTYATAAGELHGLHKAAGWMGHSGTLTVFQAHYRGLINSREAESFFEIRPEPKAGNIIHLSTEATA